MSETTNNAESDTSGKRSETADHDENTLDSKLLELLVCPSTKQPLVYDRDAAELISVTAGLAYPIREGVPIMLIDEARELTTDEIATIKSR